MTLPKRLRRDPYGLSYFGNMLNDDVPIISQSGELFFGRFHDQRYQKSQPDALRLIAVATASTRRDGSFRRTDHGILFCLIRQDRQRNRADLKAVVLSLDLDSANRTR
jgi:hypothetical protein